MNKSIVLAAVIGLTAVAGVSAMHHTGDKKPAHGKMTAEQKQAHHLDMLAETIKGSWRDPKNPARCISPSLRHPGFFRRDAA
jgi:hypothetical protein